MHLKLTKGHNFQLSNHPIKEISELKESEKIIIHPLDFPYIKPKLLIKKGDSIYTGSSLFIDKLSPNINFVSPVSGKINDIIYVIPNIGFQIKLWDFDFACIEGVVNNSKVNAKWTDKINVSYGKNQYYDIHYFFNNLK